jgi:hypothetical protein
VSLRLADEHMTGRGALDLILDRAASCDAGEVPGLVAAVASLLHADELPAAAVVEAVRHPRYRGPCTVYYRGRRARARRVERLPNGYYRADISGGLVATYDDDPFENPGARQRSG